MKIAVLGDIHANVRALEAALKIVDENGYDKLIFMGDLLTYGLDVVETLELVSERLENKRAVLLCGNHDVLYRDLLLGNRNYYDRLPAWIQESVEFNLNQLPIDVWSRISFVNEVHVDNFLFSHANPFGAENWQYLNTLPENATAAETLITRGIHVGVFGHTHRSKWFRYYHGHGEILINKFGKMDYSAVHILNAGSIGQPRENANPNSTVLWLTTDDKVVAEPTFRFQSFSWDVEGHLQALAANNFSATTFDRLSGFFE